jgi:hypothetical protein
MPKPSITAANSAIFADVRPPARAPWPALLPLIALFALSGIAQAQVDPRISACLTTPAPPCVDVIGARLLEIERETADPVARALLMKERAVLLYQLGRHDAGDAVLAAFTPQTDIRDYAIIDIIGSLDKDTFARGDTLLALMNQPDLYEIARARHIVNLVRFTDADTALEAVSTTNRHDHPLEFVGVQHLILAFVDDGRMDEALAFAAGPLAADTTERRTSILSSIVDDLIHRARLNAAQQVLALIDDPYLVSHTRARLAARYAAIGDAAQADALFKDARAQWTALPEADSRAIAFDYFAEAAVDSGRVALALEAARDVSTFRFDLAHALATVAALAANHRDPVWRDIVTEALSVLEQGPQSGADIADALDNVWQHLAVAPARGGDMPLAVSLIERISNEVQRSHTYTIIAADLSQDGQFSGALELLSAPNDANIQAQGLVALALLARDRGHRAVADEAIGRAYSMIEGPDAPLVPFDEMTIRQLVHWEVSEGHYDVAQTRMGTLEDVWLKIEASAEIVRTTAEQGTAEEFETHLAFAQDTLQHLEDPAQNTMMARYLSVTLATVDRSEEALDLALAASDQSVRDELLSALVITHGAHSRFQLGMDVVMHIADEAKRLEMEHGLLVDSLGAVIEE